MSQVYWDYKNTEILNTIKGPKNMQQYIINLSFALNDSVIFSLHTFRHFSN